MSAEFGLVTHAAERQPVKFPAECPRYRTPERGLANPRRTDEQNDGAFGIRPQLYDCQRLEYAFFNVLEAVMVLVQDAAGLVQVELFLTRSAPRQLEDIFEIGPDDVIIRSGLRQGLHSL